MVQKPKDFALLGTHIGHGQPKPGVERAYEYLQKVGFWSELKKENLKFSDFGCLPPQGPDLAYGRLYNKTLEIMDKGFRPFLIGGDHSQAFASVGALLSRYPNLRVLWVDAHADINTPVTSPSGNTHGMPLSGLLGWTDSRVWSMGPLVQHMNPQQVIYLGLHDVDSQEWELLRSYKLEYYTPDQIREQGLKSILSDIAQRWRSHPVHLSFDIDGLDSSLVPATGTPVAGGLSADEALSLIDCVKRDFNWVSCELVEFNPDLAQNPQELQCTEEHIKSLIRRLLTEPI